MSYHKETPAIISDFIDGANSVLKEFGLNETERDLAAHKLAEMIVKNWAGSLQYIPQNYALKISSRNVEIWDKFTGNNYADLAKEYGISIPWIYKIIKQARKEFQDKNQGSLF